MARYRLNFIFVAIILILSYSLSIQGDCSTLMWANSSPHAGVIAADVLGSNAGSDLPPSPPRAAVQIIVVPVALNNPLLAEIMTPGYRFSVPAGCSLIAIKPPPDISQKSTISARKNVAFKLIADGEHYKLNWLVDSELGSRPAAASNILPEGEFPTESSFRCSVIFGESIRLLKLPSSFKKLKIYTAIPIAPGMFSVGIDSPQFHYDFIMWPQQMAFYPEREPYVLRKVLIEPLNWFDHVSAALIATGLSPTEAKRVINTAQNQLADLTDEQLFNEILKANKGELEETDDRIKIAKFAILFKLLPWDKDQPLTVWKFKLPQETAYMLKLRFGNLTHCDFTAFDSHQNLSWKGGSWDKTAVVDSAGFLDIVGGALPRRDDSLANSAIHEKLPLKVTTNP